MFVVSYGIILLVHALEDFIYRVVRSVSPVINSQVWQGLGTKSRVGELVNGGDGGNRVFVVLVRLCSVVVVLVAMEPCPNFLY